jgi:anti-sigma regulatory factor (Ser/Thr protein kinase)
VTPYRSIQVEEPTQVGAARREAVALAAKLGFDEERTGRVGLVVTELGNNLVRHATGGRCLVGVAAGRRADPCVEVLALDTGPGMASFETCLRDGYSTAGTLGTGLGAAKRLADEFAYFSAPGKGTVIAARIGRSDSQAAASSPAFDISGVCLAAPGETESGDAWAVRQSNRKLAVVVADGLGHGTAAAQASTAATSVFEALEGTPSAILGKAHQALGSTRGAAVAVAELDAEQGIVTFAGAGNVIGRLISGVEDRSLLSQNGTVGLQIRQLKDIVYPWPEHSLFVLHSDGITSRWSLATVGGLLRCDASVIAGWIIRDHCRGRDDVTVVVVKRTR